MYEPKWEDKDLNRILEESRQIPTPFYLLDENRLKNNIVRLKEKTGDLFSICFSVKANPWYAVSAMEYADYVEVCSPGEWELCGNWLWPIHTGYPLNLCSSCIR